MRNNLSELNNYLFEELERLNDDETLDEKDNLDKELKRSKAITSVAGQIVQNAKVILDAKKHSDMFGNQIDAFYESTTKQITEKSDDKIYIGFGNEIK